MQEERKRNFQSRGTIPPTSSITSSINGIRDMRRAKVRKGGSGKEESCSEKRTKGVAIERMTLRQAISTPF